MDKIVTIEDFKEANAKLKRIYRANMAEIIVVEKSLPVRKFLRNLLHKEGYLGVHNFDGGKKALQVVASSEKPCFVIYELRNEELGAVDFLKVVLKLDKKQTVNVVVTVERQTRKLIQELISLGAAGILGKPVTTVEFLKKLEAFEQHG